MPREYRLYLQDILNAIDKIESFVGGASFQQVAQDQMQLDAVLYNLMTIGEAAKHIPEDVRARYPQVEWRSIGRLRDFVAHEYFGLELDSIAQVVEHQLTELRSEVTAILVQE
jgi:uncharacterized protein with HEPN domain